MPSKANKLNIAVIKIIVIKPNNSQQVLLIFRYTNLEKYLLASTAQVCLPNQKRVRTSIKLFSKFSPEKKTA